mgnify:CR=1 FL=1
MIIKMLMEIMLDEKKCEEYNVNIYECYNIIDRYFHIQGIKIVGQGFYSGTHFRDKGFKIFALSICRFPKLFWFIKCAKKWNLYTNNCVKDYLFIYKKRKNMKECKNFEKF